MISFADLLAIVAILIAGYIAYLLYKLVTLYEKQQFSDYAAYKKSIHEGRKLFRPERLRDEEGIHRIKGDKLKFTTKKANGIAQTEDALIDLTKADPEAVMGSIDEFGRAK